MAIAERELTHNEETSETQPVEERMGAAPKPSNKGSKKKGATEPTDGMEIRCDRKRLAEAVSIACRALPVRSSMPILTAVRLRANEGGLSLLSTDLEIWIEQFLPPGEHLEVVTPGSVALPGRLLADMLGRLPDGLVSLKAGDDGKSVRLKCGRSEYKPLGYPPSEFPVVQESQTAARFTLDPDDLATALRRTTFACCHDEVRAVLTGVLFRFADDATSRTPALTLAATDTHRLCVTPCPVLPDDVPGSFTGADRIAPQKSLTHLAALLPAAVAVEVTVSPRDLRFVLTRKDGGWTMVQTRVIDGQFPNYERVIPPSPPDRLRVSREDLLGAARRAQVVAVTDCSRLTFRPVRDREALEVFAQTGSSGDARDEVEADVSAGVEEFALNGGYLIQALEALQSEWVTIGCSGSARALVLNGSDEPDYDSVLMPMQVV